MTQLLHNTTFSRKMKNLQFQALTTVHPDPWFGKSYFLFPHHAPRTKKTGEEQSKPGVRRIFAAGPSGERGSASGWAKW
ncbi:MAG TPA: hypothetical protein VKP04_07100, partial [Ktedonobacteraceae bacterium]|nr:hypothetical protein [Ktedonobacteraceae bacterium]